MTTVYLDAGALMVSGGMAVTGSTALRDDAARMVGHLLASGHDVVLLGDAEQLAAARASLPLAAGMSVAPDGRLSGVARDATGWLISDSAAQCSDARGHRRLKTVLVGASAAAHDLAHRPADRFARSLGDAVMDILAAEAMPAPAGAAGIASGAR